ncbi:retrotransposon protein, putative, ty1-copia subclass [Tanacetum coccineum]
MKNYVNLECLGYVLLQELKCWFNHEWPHYNKHNIRKTVGELHAMLIKYEKGLLKKAETPQVMMIKGGKIQKSNKKSLKAKGKNKVNGKGKDKKVYIPKPKNPKPTAMEHPAKDDACHHCKEVGHWKRNCPVYLAELIKKKKQVGTASSSDVFIIELFSFPTKSWVYDTSCGTHICNTKYGLGGVRKLKQVEAVGSFDLVLPNGLVICKMTRKSFPHRPERATDLLGIIHTDVCGPLRHVSRQDRGGEYISQEFKDYLKACGIVQHLTPPYTQQHNGVSERRNRTLLDMVRSMINLTTLPLSFWDYALESATRIHNMVPTKKVDKTPYELWYEKVPNLSYLKVWGCEALVKRDTPDKLQQRSIKCIFIGYPKETMGYYFYFLPENKIVVARYAEFFEKNLITQEVSGRDMDLEEIQDEDTSPFEITSEIPMEVEGFEPPQEEDILIRRSERTRRAPNRLSLNVEAKEHSLGDLNEPTSYKAAMLDSESNKWIDAMNAEIQSMMDNMEWVLVDLPPGCKTVGSKWIFKKKTDMDGIVHTYKARLVAKGYTQMFSLVADIRAIRILISIATYYDFEIWQMDIKTAFLNGYLDEYIYMVQPEGFVDPNHPRKVCKLQRSIYGLKQATRSWDKRFDEEIKRFGFAQNLDEPCVYLYKQIRMLIKHISHSCIALYMEACHSGSIFERLLPDDMNIYVMTASNPVESSYAAYCNLPLGYDVWLGDRFSVAWMEDSETHDRRSRSIEEQYNEIKGGLFTRIGEKENLWLLLGFSCNGIWFKTLEKRKYEELKSSVVAIAGFPGLGLLLIGVSLTV